MFFLTTFPWPWHGTRRDAGGLASNCQWQFWFCTGACRKTTAVNEAMAANTICFINQKGGCGKSSCCFHLAGYFVQTGLRVLLVDADPQGSLGQALFGSQHVEALEAHETLSALFCEDGFHCSIPHLPTPTGWDGLSVVCANQTLARHNRPQPETSGLLQFVLAQYLEDLDGYDLVLVDCPPNLYQCSWNALVGADFVVVPVPPEDFGAQGLRAVHQAVENAYQLNPRLQLLGHLVTRYDGRLLVHRSYEAKLREVYGRAILKTVIPEASAFKVALACRMPVAFHAPASKAAILTSQLGREILSRIAAASTQRSAVQNGQYA
jgi:chromosome partitioning protein